MQKTHWNDWQCIYHSQILSIALDGWGHWILEALNSSWFLYTQLLVFLRRPAIDVQLFSHSSQRSLVRISLCQDWGTEEGFLPFLSSLFQKEESKFTFTSKIFHILFSPGSHIYPTIQANSSTLSSGLFQGHILVGMVKCLLVLCLSWPSLSWKSGLHLCGASPMLSSCQHSWLSFFFFFMSASCSQTMTWRLIIYKSLAFRFVSLTHNLNLPVSINLHSATWLGYLRYVPYYPTSSVWLVKSNA